MLTAIFSFFEGEQLLFVSLEIEPHQENRNYSQILFVKNWSLLKGSVPYL